MLHGGECRQRLGERRAPLVDRAATPRGSAEAATTSA
jgi:hypothetical protein